MTVAQVTLGALAPERVTFAFSNDADDPDPLDFSTVTDVVLEVRPPNTLGGAWADWAVTVLQQDAETLLVEREFEAGDVDELGFYTIRARMTVSEGTRRASGGSLLVVR